MFYCEGNDCKALSEPERKFNAACEDLNLHWARVGIAAKTHSERALPWSVAYLS